MAFRVPKILQHWRPVVSGVLLLLAFPPFNLGLFVLVALAPWLVELRTLNNRQAWKSGYLLGLVYGAGQLFWLQVFVGKWTNPVLGLVPWLLATVLFALYFGLAGLLIRLCWNRQWPWLIPLVWAGIEVFRSYLPVFAFPWGLLATPLWPYTPLIQAAHFGGIYLMSAWCVSINLIAAILLAGESPLKARPIYTVALVVVVLSLLRMSQPVSSNPMRVTIGQPGVDMAFGDQATADARLGLNVSSILVEAQRNGSQLVVLPEGIARSGGDNEPETSFRLTPGLPTLFGGQRGNDPIYQSAFAYDGKWQHADKTRLVIFGEFVPGRSWLPFLSAFKLPSGDLSAGTDGVQPLALADSHVGPVLCFEGLFPDISYRHALKGARLLAVMSIDDWFMGTTAPEQLMCASVWRSVETGLPLVRSATLGHTIAVDGTGHVLGALPVGKPEALSLTIPVPTEDPVFRFAWVFPVLSLFSPLLLIRRAQKSSSGQK